MSYLSNTTALHGYSLYVPMTADISSLVILLDIEKQKTAVSEYLDKRFGRWNDDISYDS